MSSHEHKKRGGNVTLLVHELRAHAFTNTVSGLMCSDPAKGHVVIKKTWSLPSKSLQYIGQGAGSAFIPRGFPPTKKLKLIDTDRSSAVVTRGKGGGGHSKGDSTLGGGHSAICI